MNYEIHHGGNSLNNVANLHVVAPSATPPSSRCCCPTAPRNTGCEQDIEVGRDGLVHAPTGPGLGAEIDFGLVDRKTIAVLSEER